MSKSKSPLAHRNPMVMPARMRHAGPMKDDRTKRTNEGEDWSEEIEEYQERKKEMNQAPEQWQYTLNLVKVFIDYATTQCNMSVLGQNVATEIEKLPCFSEEPRLQRIHKKFSELDPTDEEKFDAFLMDLFAWGEYNNTCKIIIPMK